MGARSLPLPVPYQCRLVRFSLRGFIERLIIEAAQTRRFALRLSIRLFYPKGLLQKAHFVVELAALILVR